MPWTIVQNENEWCVHKENEDGSAGDKVACHSSEAEARGQMRALYANVEEAAGKYFRLTGGVKAAGDWELDVLAIPFNSHDSDGQWFDANTDIMHEQFETPIVVYQHGVGTGGKSIDEHPSIIGKAVRGTLRKMADGWHINVILDKAKEQAKRIMQAVKDGMVAVSSGSISHLARLDTGGRLIQYEKSRPGRIAVWALGEISLWERGNGNFEPANQFAVALPAMKAIYREAGIPFPDIDTTGVSEAQDEARKRAEIARKKALQQITKRSK